MSTTYTMKGCACWFIPNCITSRNDILTEYVDFDFCFVVLDPEYLRSHLNYPTSFSTSFQIKTCKNKLVLSVKTMTYRLYSWRVSEASYRCIRWGRREITRFGCYIGNSLISYHYRFPQLSRSHSQLKSVWFRHCGYCCFRGVITCCVKRQRVEMDVFLFCMKSQKKVFWAG